jgi:threonyl-tRNA synthetase
MSLSSANAIQVKVTLPDGSHREVPQGTTLRQLAEMIGAGLARAALAGSIDGKLVDLSTPIEQDCSVEIHTFRDQKGRYVFRHSAAHVTAQAIEHLHPGTRFAIGPPTEDGIGYYYDIELPEGKRLGEEDLAKIEEEMDRLVKADLSFSREVMERAPALEYFKAKGDPYKVQLIEDLPEDQTLTFYKQGDFTDLCRGPHVPSTGVLKAMKLTSLAGAYWRGSEKGPMLQRVYGVAFNDKKALQEHVRVIEEAKKRDHRKLGKELDLFSFHEEGPGFPFYHHNGTVLLNELVTYLRGELFGLGYREVVTPMILNESLWRASGHWDNYKENMYFTEVDESAFAVKPMNCPGCCLIFREGLRSYRDLPLKMAEFGRVHRHERSGVLHGLFRARVFTQDDAHIYCEENQDQIEEVVGECLDLVFRVYGTFGFDNIHVELSTKPAKAIGSDEIWEKSTSALRSVLEKRNINYQLNPGDGAFYGPKIDYHIKDCLGRSWQCGTIQLDFSMPQRFGLQYVSSDGSRKTPVMIHRAIFGSLERFLGILIEHFAGNFPLWLAPQQVAVLSITEGQAEYAQEIRRQLVQAGLRAEVDASSDKIGAKIRNAEIRKVPVMFVVGRQEAESGNVAVRRHGLGDLGQKPLAEAIAALVEEAKTRALPPAPKEGNGHK